MKLSHDSKIVLWFICCALAGAFLQSVLDPIDLTRTGRSNRHTVRARQVRRRAEMPLVYH